jgi:hypothetical protein
VRSRPAQPTAHDGEPALVPTLSKRDPRPIVYYMTLQRTIVPEMRFAPSTPRKSIFTMGRSPTPLRPTAQLRPAPRTYAGQRGEIPAQHASRWASRSRDKTLSGDWKLHGDSYCAAHANGLTITVVHLFRRSYRLARR